MKGEWKNSVSGWNNKDTRRKKQTHNHRLKDNGRLIYHKFNGWKSKLEANPDVFRTEGATEIVYTGSRYNDEIIHYDAEIFYVQVSWNKVDENGEFIVDYIGSYNRKNYKKEYRYIKAYKDENTRCGYSDENCKWRTLDGIKISEYLGLTNSWKWEIEVTSMRRTQKRIKLCTDDIIKRKSEIHISDFDSGEDFMYGKPLPSWRWFRFYGDGRRRKFAQNNANRMDRRNIKNWINKHDISLEVKTHALSKSIAWEVS